MAVSEPTLQSNYNEETNISELKSVYAEVSELLDINFFLNELELNKKHDIENIAQVIKGKSYEKTKKKISEFKAQCKESLENIKINQEKLRAELNSYINNIKRGDSATQAQVMYGAANGASEDDIKGFLENQGEVRKRVTDIADGLKKKYDDEVSKYNEKELEFKEQLVKKLEVLKLALDQDIVTLVAKLKQIVFSSIRNDEFFKGFILGNLTRVAYVFLYDIIDSIAAQHEVNGIFDELNAEISKIVDDNSELLKNRLLAYAKYLNNCYTMNEPLLNEIENNIKNLPYKQCENSKPLIENILRISTEKVFDFKDIIDPGKLNNIKNEIEIYKSELQKSLNECKSVLNNNLSVFDNINAQVTSLNTRYDQMVRNKESFLKPVFKELYFTLGLLNENSHNFYMKDFKRLIGEISVDLNNIYKVKLSEILERIQITDMLTIPAKQNLENNTVLDFLKYKEKLIIKKEDLNNKISDLDRLLVEIDDVPKTSSQKYMNKISNWFWIALLPIANIVILISMYSVLNKLKPAINSGNSYYDELFQVIMNKYKINMYIHIGLIVILGLVSLATVYLFYVLMLLYIISAIMIFSQKLILKSFKDTMKQ